MAIYFSLAGGMHPRVPIGTLGFPSNFPTETSSAALGGEVTDWSSIVFDYAVTTTRLTRQAEKHA